MGTIFIYVILTNLNKMNNSTSTEILESMGYTLQNSSIFQDALDEAREPSSLFSKNTLQTECQGDKKC